MQLQSDDGSSKAWVRESDPRRVGQNGGALLTCFAKNRVSESVSSRARKVWLEWLVLTASAAVAQ